MALENAGGIATLGSANPTEADPAAEGNEHIQLIKSILKAQFPPEIPGDPASGLGAIDDSPLPINITLARITTLETANTDLMARVLALEEANFLAEDANGDLIISRDVVATRNIAAINGGVSATLDITTAADVKAFQP